MKKNTLLILSLLTTLACTANGKAYSSSTTNKVDYYDKRYALPDADTKLVDNYGNGYEDLYGTRNFRTILKGVAYRGGANNYYHRDNPRNNQNPLPDDGLQNLCEEGFKNAVYLYSTNFSSAPKTTNCASSVTTSNTLEYLQVSPMSASGSYSILKLIYDAILDETKAPLYLHCWNGWHASGLISAYTLMQFCGYSTTQAVNYWDRNTDGVNTDPGYESIRNKIRSFKPYNDLLIDPSVSAKICF